MTQTNRSLAPAPSHTNKHHTHSHAHPIQRLPLSPTHHHPRPQHPPLNSRLNRAKSRTHRHHSRHRLSTQLGPINQYHPRPSAPLPLGPSCYSQTVLSFSPSVRVDGVTTGIYSLLLLRTTLHTTTHYFELVLFSSFSTTTITLPPSPFLHKQQTT
jgi:hypothetical protein